MKAVLTVIGRDSVGILSLVSGACAAQKVNIEEVSQSVLQDLFCMIMLVDLAACPLPLAQFADQMSALGNEKGLAIHVMHEDIFQAMHHI
ncbi:MAG: ACT domain-containing protein [Oscillospiraceae bacterium]|jgi:ACT domain-containing protein|nr:ACT domain-containing protein [Oscillospiraceae bacterium]